MASIKALRTAEVSEPAGQPGPSLQTAGGVAALLESIGIVASGVLILGVAPALGMKDTYWGEPSKSVPVIAGHLTFFTSAALFIMLTALILFPVVLALHWRLREQAPGVVAVATALGLVGTTMQFLNALLQYAEFHVVGEYSRAFAVQALPGAQIVYNATGGAADVAFGLWVLLVSWVVIRRGGLPRWLGYFGLLVGLVDFLGLAGPPVGELVGIVWFIAVGMVLMRPSMAVARRASRESR